MTYPQLLLAHTIAERTNLISISLSHSHTLMMMMMRMMMNNMMTNMMMMTRVLIILSYCWPALSQKEPILSVSYTCGDDDDAEDKNKNYDHGGCDETCQY